MKTGARAGANRGVGPTPAHRARPNLNAQHEQSISVSSGLFRLYCGRPEASGNAPTAWHLSVSLPISILHLGAPSLPPSSVPVTGQCSTQRRRDSLPILRGGVCQCGLTFSFSLSRLPTVLCYLAHLRKSCRRLELSTGDDRGRTKIELSASDVPCIFYPNSRPASKSRPRAHQLLPSTGRGCANGETGCRQQSGAYSELKKKLLFLATSGVVAALLQLRLNGPAIVIGARKSPCSSKRQKCSAGAHGASQFVQLEQQTTRGGPVADSVSARTR